MSRSRIITAVLLSSVILSFAVTAGAQEKFPAPANQIKLKLIKKPGTLYNIISIQDFFPIKKNYGLALADAKPNTDDRGVYILKLTKNGKSTVTDTFAEQLESFPNLSAVMFSSPDSAGPATAPRGLLFCGLEDEDYAWVKVLMAKFSSAGKFTSNPTEILYLPLPTGFDEILMNSVQTAVGPHSIAVAVSMEVYVDAAKQSSIVARFFEMDFDGNIIGSIREIPFDPNKNQYAYFQKPIWSGMRWMVPARVTEPGTTRRFSCQVVCVDSLVATAPISATDFSIEEIYDSGSPNKYISQVDFLPLYDGAGAAAQPAAGGMINLLIHTLSDIPDHTAALSKSNNGSLVQQFQNTGSKVRKPRLIKTKPWSRALTVEQDMRIEDYREYYSRFLALGADSYLALRADHIERRSEVAAPSSAYLDEGRVILLSFEKKLRKIEELITIDFKGEEYPGYWPLLAEKDGKYWLIVTTRDPEASKTKFYLGTLVL